MMESFNTFFTGIYPLLLVVVSIVLILVVIVAEKNRKSLKLTNKELDYYKDEAAITKLKLEGLLIKKYKSIWFGEEIQAQRVDIIFYNSDGTIQSSYNTKIKNIDYCYKTIIIDFCGENITINCTEEVFDSIMNNLSDEK